MGILSNLEPKEVFYYFEQICAIPHGSSDTKRISDYLVDFAKEHHLRYIQDEWNNVILFKDASTGYEDSPPVMLQGHIDMVCEKDADCDIDFHTDGLSLEVNDGIIRAKGTTLGGDDGIAVAFMLAILSSDTIPHPPLEAVFTVDEEIGMLGAAALDCSPLKSRIMLNLDSEDEGHLLVSCAGGVTATAQLPIHFQKAEGIPVLLSVRGLIGGHSGVEIDKGRANACTLLGRILYDLKKNGMVFSLISINGGLKDNAIPREASAVLLADRTCSISEMEKRISHIQNVISHEYRQTDPAIRISLETSQGKDSHEMTSAMDSHSSQAVITALNILPNGIQKMSHEIEGLVQTSLNLGIMSTGKQEVTFSYAVRSNVQTEKEALTDKICCLMEHLNGTVTFTGDYPAWEYKKESPLRDRMVSIFERQYGRKPIIEALHAGVECGLFAGKIEGLDCISYGPDMKDIHTPNESMDVKSVQRTWEYTLEILRELKG